MNTQKATRTSLHIICIVIVTYFSFDLWHPTPTFAQEFSLSVSPTTTAVSLKEPNQEQKQTFTLTNNSTSAKKIFIQLFPIEKVDKLTNRPIYQSISTLTKTQQSFYQSAISFGSKTRKINEITLAPKQTETIEMTVRYTEELEKTDYYFTIGFTDNDPLIEAREAENDVTGISQTRAIIGSNVFVSLGDHPASLEIREFSVNNTFSNSLPGTKINLTNTGGKYINGYIKVSLYNMIGLKTAEYTSDNVILLKNTTKEITVNPTSFISKLPLYNLASLGLNKIVLEVHDRESEMIYTEKLTFILLPYHVGVALIAILICVSIIAKKVKQKMA